MRQDGMRDLTMQMNKRDVSVIPVQIRQAVVTAVTAPTVTIQFAGEAAIEGVRRFTFYSAPAVNDNVWVVQNGADLFVLGTLA